MLKLSKAIILGAALSSSTIALAENSGWSISEADGQVSVIRGERSIYGAEGTQLQVGDVVRTSKAANAVLVRGSDFHVVSANSRVRIIETQEQGMISQALQFLGDMLHPGEVQRRANQPMLAAVVKGFGDDAEPRSLTGSDNTTENAEEQVR